MWLKGGRRATERDAALRHAKVLELEATLGRAAIDARRGEYELARQTASEFFNFLTEEVRKAGGSSFNPAQQANLEALLKERNDLITLLPRSDLASAERLADIHVAFPKALAEQNPPSPAESANR
jgi:hypothetical protein